MKPELTRAEVLRDILVERVEVTPERRASPRGGVVALIIAFVAGAVLVGGTLSATALVTGQTHDYDTVTSASAGGSRQMGTHDQLVGEPFELSAAKGSRLALGPKPEGASALVLAVSCVGVGKIAVAVDATRDMKMTCNTDGGGTSSYAQVNKRSDSHSIVVDIERGTVRYSVWAAWVVKQEVPEFSDEQAAALADRVVTRDEYLAGFDRYAACMLEAGFDVAGTKAVHLVIYTVPDAAVRSGDDMACYEAEFRQLDVEWQTVGQYLDTQQ